MLCIFFVSCLSNNPKQKKIIGNWADYSTYSDTLDFDFYSETRIFDEYIETINPMLFTPIITRYRLVGDSIYSIDPDNDGKYFNGKILFINNDKFLWKIDSFLVVSYRLPNEKLDTSVYAMYERFKAHSELFQKDLETLPKVYRGDLSELPLGE